jgi:hypothetical protein
LNQNVICSCLLPPVAVFCRSVSRQCPTEVSAKAARPESDDAESGGRGSNRLTGETDSTERLTPPLL